MADGVGRQLGGDDLGLVDERLGQVAGLQVVDHLARGPCRPRPARAGAQGADDAVDARAGDSVTTRPLSPVRSEAPGSSAVVVGVGQVRGHGDTPSRSPRTVETTRPGRLVMMTSTPSSRQRSMSLVLVDGPDVDLVTAALERPDDLGLAQQDPHVQADAGSPWGSEPVAGAQGHRRARRGRPSGSVGAQLRASAARARCENDIIRTCGRPGWSPSVEVEQSQHLDERALDVAAVPGGVLGLDEGHDLLAGARRACRAAGAGSAGGRARGRSRAARRRRGGRRLPRAPSRAPRAGPARAPRRRLRPLDVRSTRRSCTQTRWWSAVSRTSHSTPSAPWSKARR